MNRELWGWRVWFRGLLLEVIDRLVPGVCRAALVVWAITGEADQIRFAISHGRLNCKLEYEPGECCYCGKYGRFCETEGEHLEYLERTK